MLSEICSTREVYSKSTKCKNWKIEG